MSQWQPCKHVFYISSFQSWFAGTNSKKSENSRAPEKVNKGGTLRSGPAGNAAAEPVCHDLAVYGTEDMRPARAIEQACLNGIWQAPQNGLLTWRQFAGWEVRYSRSSRRLPLVLCTSCGWVWLRSPLAMGLWKLTKKCLPCYVCSSASFSVLTSEGSNTKALTKKNPAHKQMNRWGLVSD